ncbi:MAG: hypothetical protein QGF53_01745 [Alphaproteobacteria bacterium]|nr:hypothetical protein [Alphaproteobacteria bacterium]
MSIVLAALYVAAGVFVLSAAGEAEVGFGPSALAVLFAMSSGPLLVYLAIAAIIPAPLPRPRGRRLAALLGGIFLCYGLVLASGARHQALVEESQIIGDTVVEEIEAYRRLRGGYPLTLADIGDIAAPALSGSQYHYFADDAEGYILSFPAGNLVNCMRTAQDPVWFCDD